MSSRLRRITAAFCLVFLVSGITLPLSASASSPNSILNSSDSEANNKTSPLMVDLLILRPVGLVALGLSFILFVVPVAPITLLTRPSEIGKPAKAMIADPARFVWADPLGSH